MLTSMIQGVRKNYQKVRIAWFLARSRPKLRRIARHFAGIYTPQEKLEMARRALLELRDGEHNTNVGSDLNKINEALELGWSYKKIGTTKQEVIEFRNGKSQRIFATKLLEKTRSGKSIETSRIRDLVKEGVLSLEDIGVSEEELISWDRKWELKFRKKEIQELRTMASNNFVEAQKEIISWGSMWKIESFERRILQGSGNSDRKFDFSPEELGITQEEIHALTGRALLNKTRVELEGIRNAAAKGVLSEFEIESRKIVEQYPEDPDRWLRMEGFKFLLKKIGASLEDIGSSDDELRNLFRISKINNARHFLDNLRKPTEKEWFFLGFDEFHISDSKELIRRPEWHVELIQRRLGSADASLSDIGTNNEEMKILCKKGYFFIADLVVKRLRLVSGGVAEPDLEDGERYPVESALEVVRESLVRGGGNLSDIASSEDELNNFRQTLLGMRKIETAI